MTKSKPEAWRFHLMHWLQGDKVSCGAVGYAMDEVKEITCPKCKRNYNKIRRHRKKPGSRQRDVLIALREHRGWEPNCGWHWNSQRGTEQIMENLFNNGWANRFKIKGTLRNRYRISRKGMDAISK